MNLAWRALARSGVRPLGLRASSRHAALPRYLSTPAGAAHSEDEESVSLNEADYVEDYSRPSNEELMLCDRTRSYTNHGQEFPSEILDSAAEQLPAEEPTLFETWGFWPHAGLLTTIVLTKEIIPCTPELCAIVFMSAGWAALWSAARGYLISVDRQAEIEEYTTSVEPLKKIIGTLDESIGYTKSVSSLPQLTPQLLGYTQELRDKEKELEAFEFKKQIVEKFEERLTLFEQREREHVEAVEKQLFEKVKTQVDSQMESDSFRKTYLQNALRQLKGEDIADPVESMFDSALKAEHKTFKSNLGKEQPIPDEIKSKLRLDSESDKASDLNLLGLSTQVPETYIPQQSGVFGPIPKSAKVSPTRAQLAQITKQKLAEAASRYLPAEQSPIASS